MLNSRLIVIVPALNEEASIVGVVRSVRAVLPGIPLLVIDDHSHDSTARVAAEAGARVVRLPRHLGLAGCLRTGYRMALEEGFETVIRIDGDGQHEASDIPEMLLRLRENGADVVVGSRFIASGRWQSSLMRSAGIRFLRFLAARAVGQKIQDPTSGFIGVNRRALELLATSESPYPEVLALIALKRNCCRIQEIPCRMYPRSAGQSSMTFIICLCYTGRILKSLLREPISPSTAAAHKMSRAVPDIPNARHGFESE